MAVFPPSFRTLGAGGSFPGFVCHEQFPPGSNPVGSLQPEPCNQWVPLAIPVGVLGHN